MSTALWASQLVLAFFITLDGVMKVTSSDDKLRSLHLPSGPARVLGVLEVLAGIALIVPGLVGVAVILTPVMAVCVALGLIGAIVFRRKHPTERGTALLWVMAVVATVVAVTRFGPFPLG